MSAAAAGDPEALTSASRSTWPLRKAVVTQRRKATQGIRRLCGRRPAPWPRPGRAAGLNRSRVSCRGGSCLCRSPAVAGRIQGAQGHLGHRSQPQDHRRRRQPRPQRGRSGGRDPDGVHAAVGPFRRPPACFRDRSGAPPCFRRSWFARCGGSGWQRGLRSAAAAWPPAGAMSRTVPSAAPGKGRRHVPARQEFRQ